MIEVEGYKAFRGTMRIAPGVCEPYELTCDWLYNPDWDCWYGGGRSFPDVICKVVQDETRKEKAE
jgi:hypothetical protein